MLPPRAAQSGDRDPKRGAGKTPRSPFAPARLYYGMEFVGRYEHAISWMVHHVGGRDKFLHTNVGLAIWLIAALVLRKPLRSPWPIMVVLLFEIGNECIDLLAHGVSRWGASLIDIAVTMFWPVLLALLFRIRPVLRR
jgi:hypothetical protein